MREADDLALDERRSLRWHHEGSDLLSPLLARHTRDSDLLNGGMRLQDELHLARVDVEAAGDDQLLEPASNGERSVLADLPDVAGLEEAVRSEGLRRRVGVSPVAPEDLAPLEQHLVELAEPHLHAGKWIADPARLPRPVVGIRHDDSALGDAVALDRGLPQ